MSKGSLYKEFLTGQIGNLKSTGVAAISGEVVRILDENTITMAVTEYDREKQKEVSKKHEVSLEEIGGADPDAIKKGMTLTCIGELTDDDVLVAKEANSGNCYLTYKGYGIAAGETKYEEKPNYGSDTEMNIVAKIKAYDAKEDVDVLNKFYFSGHKWGNDESQQTSHDKVKKTLDIAAKRFELKLDERYNKNAFEGKPFDSAITFKVNDKVSQKTNEPYNAVKKLDFDGRITYIRNEYSPYVPTSCAIGDPDMDKIKAYEAKRAERQAEYEESHSNVKEEEQAPIGAEETKEEIENTDAFEIDEMEADYGE